MQSREIICLNVTLGQINYGANEIQIQLSKVCKVFINYTSVQLFPQPVTVVVD